VVWQCQARDAHGLQRKLRHFLETPTRAKSSDAVTVGIAANKRSPGSRGGFRCQPGTTVGRPR
jgi:hypothetical protein